MSGIQAPVVRNMRSGITWFVSMALVLGSSFAHAQDYPRKPVRILTAPAGGGLDFIARTLGQSLGPMLGQQVIVDNRPTRLLPELALKAPADGYTLLVHGGALWLLPFMSASASYDPLRDFSPITLIARAPLVLVVHPSLPAKSVKDLLTLARSRPADLNYASGSSGSSSHLAGELFKYMTGTGITRIPYKGLGDATNDLLGGRVHMMFATAPTAAGYVAAGRLRALAVTSAERSPLAPGLPALAAAGVPGYEAETLYGLFVPGRTPQSLIDRLHQESVRVIDTSEVKARLFKSGSDAVGSTPAQFAGIIKAEMERMGRVIKDAGIREE